MELHARRSATVSFGQALDADVFDAAAHGARVVIVDAEPPPHDGLADLVVREPISAVLPRLPAAAG